MSSHFIRGLMLVLFLTVGALADTPASVGQRLEPWHEGGLDIYHINTGRGNCAYFIFPDGTTMLFDAGDLNAAKFAKNAPLKLVEPRPDNSRPPGEWVVRFIQAVSPAGAPVVLDYALISHFHDDHLGHVETRTPVAANGAYKLSGLTQVGDAIPIHRLIDRGFPDYDVPADLAALYGDTFRNYQAFARYQARVHGLRLDSLHVGRDDQIVLLKNAPAYPSFAVRNVKSNGMIWTGKGTGVTEAVPVEALRAARPLVENPLCLALKLTYGAFSYYTGGDNTGLRGFGQPSWFDMETPIAAAVGPVDALTLNHHGNRDATNATFLSALAPRVIVQQSWTSDHPGGEVLHRMIAESLYAGPRDIFSTNMREETKVAIGPWLTKAYKSFEGHILIRVAPGGERYEVVILNDQTEGQIVRARHGPYQAKGLTR